MSTQPIPGLPAGWALDEMFPYHCLATATEELSGRSVILRVDADLNLHPYIGSAWAPGVRPAIRTNGVLDLLDRTPDDLAGYGEPIWNINNWAVFYDQQPIHPDSVDYFGSWYEREASLRSVMIATYGVYPAPTDTNFELCLMFDLDMGGSSDVSVSSGLLDNFEGPLHTTPVWHSTAKKWELSLDFFDPAYDPDLVAANIFYVKPGLDAEAGTHAQVMWLSGLYGGTRFMLGPKTAMHADPFAAWEGGVSEGDSLEGEPVMAVYSIPFDYSFGFSGPEVDVVWMPAEALTVKTVGRVRSWND